MARFSVLSRTTLSLAASMALVALPALLGQSARAQQSNDLILQGGGNTVLSGLQDFARFAAAQYQRIETATQTALASERGFGTCEQRAEAFSLVLPQAAYLADLNRDLYHHTYDGQMWQKGATMMTAEVAPGVQITVYRDPATDGYAELYPAKDDQAAVLIFRGTQVTSVNDILANITQFAGAIPPKYQWASALTAQTVRELNGQRLIVSGHSLGGGLAMYAGLKNNVPAVTFNPAGLSKMAFDGLPEQALIQASDQTTTYISRSGSAVDPVSALSLAGDSIIIGQRYVVDLGIAANQLQTHDVGLLANRLQALSQKAASMNPEELCEGDLGARPLL